MSKAKWVMKQYWRVGTIRAILGVVMGMLVLGRYYYGFIPPLAELGFVGALLLGGFLFLLFLGFGYIYDEQMKLWNEKIQVENEKNPYSFIPPIHYEYFEYPFFSTIIESWKRISKKLEIEGSHLDEFSNYLSDYFSRSPGSRSDLFGAQPKADEFRVKHPFVESEEPPSSKWSVSHRAKKNSMLNIWRWNWVQNFTGLPQDVLVLTALLGGVVFSEFLVDNKLPPEYLQIAVTYFAFPLFFALLIVGWFYDRKLKLWSPDQIVKVERNPYSFVPDPKIVAYGLPFFYCILEFYVQLYLHLSLDTTELKKMISYLDHYSVLSAAQDADMEKARSLRREFGPVFSQIFQSKKEDD